MSKKMSKKTKEQISNKLEEKKIHAKPLFIIIVVLIIVVIGISLAYAINQNMINKEKEAKIAELQKKVNNLTDYIESLQVGAQGAPGVQEEAPVSVVGPWPEYANDTFGFSLTMPDIWEGYLLTENANFIDFGFVEQNPVARISVIGHEQWDQVRTQENNGLIYLGENEQFVIVYSLVTQAVDENIQALILEFPTIMETLTLAEGELTVKDYSVEEEVAEDFTYTNEEYGFSLEYPDDWEVESNNNSYKVKKTGDQKMYSKNIENSSIFYFPHFSIGVHSTDMEDISEYIEKQRKSSIEEGIGVYPNILKNTKVDNLKAVWLTSCIEMSSNQGPVVLKDGYVYYLTIPFKCIYKNGPDDIEDPDFVSYFNELDGIYGPTLNKILSTFKFTN